MTTTSTAYRITTDAWALRVMAEAKAYRDANPATTAEQQASDAYLDAYLEACQDAAAEVGTTEERPTADEAPAPRTSNGGNTSTGSNRNAPSPAQLAYLAKLEAQLGYELQTPRDKSHASLLIDGAKKALAAKPATDRPARPVTPGQAAYLVDLLATRAHTLGEVDPTALTFDAASAMIEALQATPRAAKATAAHGIAEGHYAHRDAEGVAHFYRVTDTGRIRVIAGPSEHPYNGQLNEGLTWIAANQRDAAALYGQLIGRCGRCHRRLSDDDSIKRGLGPFCAEKF